MSVKLAHQYDARINFVIPLLSFPIQTGTLVYRPTGSAHDGIRESKWNLGSRLECEYDLFGWPNKFTVDEVYVRPLRCFSLWQVPSRTLAIWCMIAS